jgi:ribosome-binding ATPase YchF (GTP1/OBG family)
MLIGIVGKPSVGKSTFFMAATSVPVERSPRPFTTIKPNRAVAYVEVECVDKEFGRQCNPRTGYCVNGRRFVPVELLDVAGLVPGAHEGKGLGNKFLDDLRQADILVHVVDASGSTNEVGGRVPTGSYDPCNDVRFLEQELDYWIEGILDNNWQKLVREARLNKKNEDMLTVQFSGLGMTKDIIAKVLKELKLEDKNLAEWGEEEKLALAKTIRRLGKPIIIAANKCDLSSGWDNYNRLKKEFPDYLVIPCSAEAEIALKEAAKKGFVDYIPGDKAFTVKAELNAQQKSAMDVLRAVCDRYGGTGVQKCLDSAVFDFLHYIAIFPGGVSKLEDSEGRVLPDCFLMPPKTTALDFAFKLHSDIGKGFIKAIDVKTRQAVGKEHVLKHRDVIEILFKKPS